MWVFSFFFMWWYVVGGGGGGRKMMDPDPLAYTTVPDGHYSLKRRIILSVVFLKLTYNLKS